MTALKNRDVFLRDPASTIIPNLGVTKVIEPEKIEDAQRAALGNQLRQAVAAQELEATLTSLRNRVGVTVKKGALDAKDSGSGPAPKKS